MKTISNREFIANPDLYLNIATEQEVRIRRGRQVLHITCEAPATAQPIHQPDDDFRRAISIDDFKERVLARIEKLDEKYARK